MPPCVCESAFREIHCELPILAQPPGEEEIALLLGIFPEIFTLMDTPALSQNGGLSDFTGPN